MGTARRTITTWPHRFAVATCLFAVPLVLFGGSVTTIGAGMAVEGWLIAEGHFLLFFPVEAWFRDVATFVEHTHRLFGVLVGLAGIATVVATWLMDRRRSARILSVAALVAICVQGALGGLRVLENDAQLAFVHGALAQCVFALLCVTALVLSPRWRDADAGFLPGTARLRGLAGGVVLVVLYQVVTGAWYRHSIRPVVEQGATTLLLTHAVGAVLVLVGVVLFARRLREAVRRGEAPTQLANAPLRLQVLLGLQGALGILAWLGFRPDTVGPLEWTLTIAHVLGGGLLLAQSTAIWGWCLRTGLAARLDRTVHRPASEVL